MKLDELCKYCGCEIEPGDSVHDVTTEEQTGLVHDDCFADYMRQYARDNLGWIEYIYGDE